MDKTVSMKELKQMPLEALVLTARTGRVDSPSDLLTLAEREKDSQRAVAYLLLYLRSVPCEERDPKFYDLAPLWLVGYSQKDELRFQNKLFFQGYLVPFYIRFLGTDDLLTQLSRSEAARGLDADRKTAMTITGLPIPKGIPDKTTEEESEERQAFIDQFTLRPGTLCVYSKYADELAPATILFRRSGFSKENMLEFMGPDTSEFTHKECHVYINKKRRKAIVLKDGTAHYCHSPEGYPLQRIMIYFSQLIFAEPILHASLLGMGVENRNGFITNALEEYTNKLMEENIGADWGFNLELLRRSMRNEHLQKLFDRGVHFPSFMLEEFRTEDTNDIIRRFEERNAEIDQERALPSTSEPYGLDDEGLRRYIQRLIDEKYESHWIMMLLAHAKSRGLDIPYDGNAPAEYRYLLDCLAGNCDCSSLVKITGLSRTNNPEEWISTAEYWNFDSSFNEAQARAMKHKILRTKAITVSYDILLKYLRRVSNNIRSPYYRDATIALLQKIPDEQKKRLQSERGIASVYIRAARAK